MSDGLVAFLRARLDEDAARQQDRFERWHHRDCESLPDGNYPTFACDCGVPARALADVQAKRALLDEHVSSQQTLDAIDYPDMQDVGRVAGLETALQYEALPYSNHPDYREDWRP